jgi:hypothetical protein
MCVVSHVSTSNGAGGSLDADYTYGGAQADLSGRGFLGFWWTKSVAANNIPLTTYTMYYRGFPYTGIPAQTTLSLNGSVLKQSVNSVTFNSPAPYPGVVFPYVSQSIESGSDLNGAALPTVTTNIGYDTFGNAKSVSVSTGDGYSKSTTNIYANDTANWFLGRLIRSQVTSTAP